MCKITRDCGLSVTVLCRHLCSGCAAFRLQLSTAQAFPASAMSCGRNDTYTASFRQGALSSGFCLCLHRLAFLAGGHGSACVVCRLIRIQFAMKNGAACLPLPCPNSFSHRSAARVTWTTSYCRQETNRCARHMGAAELPCLVAQSDSQDTLELLAHVLHFLTRTPDVLVSRCCDIEATGSSLCSYFRVCRTEAGVG